VIEVWVKTRYIDADGLHERGEQVEFEETVAKKLVEFDILSYSPIDPPEAPAPTPQPEPEPVEAEPLAGGPSAEEIIAEGPSPDPEPLIPPEAVKKAVAKKATKKQPAPKKS
jgi:hypothetical protein